VQLTKVSRLVTSAEVRPNALVTRSFRLTVAGICCAQNKSRKSSMPALLQVSNLNVSYLGAGSSRHQAVENVSFEIGEGEVLGLMGESGCGKTSIALALLGLLSEDGAHVAGSIQFRGEELLAKDVRALRAVRGAGISLVFQEPELALSPVMKIRDQVAEVIHAHNDWKWDRCRADAESALARVGFSDVPRISSAYPHQLSGGQRQRVVLAQALASKPALLIADEPAASLDARSQSDILALLRELQHEMHISILLISHAPEVQARLADRLLVMANGRIVEQGPFEQLYRNPSHACTRAMLRTKAAASVAEDMDFEMVT
jgi:ABC-type glutathione transport system ATPase component